MTHDVTLPHPRRDGAPATGVCICGWTVTYTWGDHGAAADAACEHITKKAHANAVQAQRFDGQIHVMEGRSL